MALPPIIQIINYSLTDHPSILTFRWNHADSWGSTWSFLFTAIFTYIAAAIFLHLLLLRRHRPIPLGPLSAIHSLITALTSATIFIGILLSAVAEIRDTRWFWNRTKTTPFQWFLCFPLGTRSSGRVFFWSYIFYLSRFLHLFRTFLLILQRRRSFAVFQIFNQSILLFMSFLWLEFSQSFQVLAILLTTSIYTVVHGYRFWTAIGLPVACFPIEVNCQIILLGCSLICHFGVISFHFLRGGCNGIGAWGFNSVLNAAILLLFLKFYLKKEGKMLSSEIE